MTTIQLKYTDIPSYLYAGEFYRSLSSEDPEGIIEIPANCFHHDGKTGADIEEFRQLLRVMVFWMLDDIPLGVLDFCYKNEVDTWCHAINELPTGMRIEILPLLLAAFQDQSRDTLFSDVLILGRWDIIMHVIGHLPKDANAAIKAAKCGNLRVLRILHKKGFVWDEETCSAAALEGHLDCLRYAHENGCPWNSDVITLAAQHGHLSCLMYAHENGCPWDIDVYRSAAEFGHVDCMEYAHQQGLEWHDDVSTYSAYHGQLACLQYAHENGCPWDAMTTCAAAHEGHLDCLVYALEHGCSVDEKTSIAAAEQGQLACLQLLADFGAPWNELTCATAAKCSSADCLQFLQETGCPWDESTPANAALHGSVDCLQYALEHGCPYSDSILPDAARGGNVLCVQFLIETWGANADESLFITALLRGNMKILEYICDQGYPYLGADITDNERDIQQCDKLFVRNNPQFRHCVKYAVERGWSVTQSFVDFVCSRDEHNTKLLLYLIEGKWLGDTARGTVVSNEVCDEDEAGGASNILHDAAQIEEKCVIC